MSQQGDVAASVPPLCLDPFERRERSEVVVAEPPGAHARECTGHLIGCRRSGRRVGTIRVAQQTTPHCCPNARVVLATDRLWASMQELRRLRVLRHLIDG